MVAQPSISLPLDMIIHGDALDVLRTLPSTSVQCCITSPPYWGLRDYGIDGQIGLEETPEEYTEKLVVVFREVWRVLAEDGVLWLNLGDSYAGSNKGEGNIQHGKLGKNALTFLSGKTPDIGLKPKNLVGIPWRVAFALQADGWILRSDVIWEKPNCMPESVQDRPTKSHEYLFLLAKSERYYYDADAIKESATTKPHAPGKRRHIAEGTQRINPSHGQDGALIDPSRIWANDGNRNRRTVWSIPTKAYAGAHFAVMPQKLVEPCILSSSRPGYVILDPFSGAGTVALVAMRHKRRYIGIELNASYCELARARIECEDPPPSLWDGGAS